MRSSAKAFYWIVSLLATAGAIAAAKFLSYDDSMVMWVLIGVAFFIYLGILIFDNKGWGIFTYCWLVVITCVVLGHRALSTSKEELFWERAVKVNTPSAYESFLKDFPDGSHRYEAQDSIDVRRVDQLMGRKPYPDLVSIIEDSHSSISKKRAISYLDEYYDWKKRSNQVADYKLLKAYVKYRADGPYYDEARAILLPIEDDEEYALAIKLLTKESLTSYLERFPGGRHVKEAQAYLKYWDYSLKSGSKPYSYKYGQGESGYTMIRVNASPNNDVVLIAKHHDNKRVANHVYVRKNETGDIYLPSGTYMVYFYSGRGWNPHKILANGLRGGFIHNESWGKDDTPVEITIFAGREYTLKEVINGNFHMDPSSLEEAM